MLTHKKKLLIFWALVLAFALWIRWWSSSGFPPEGQICEISEPTKNCESYNVFFYSAWRLALVANYWGVLITAVATAVIGYFTYTLGRSTEQMRKITQEATNIAAEQMLIAGRQTDIIDKQHALERLQFLATQRPRLRVRHVSIIAQGKSIGHPNFFFTNGNTVKGSLIVVNIGGSKATIIESRYRIFFTKTGLPASAPYDDDFRADLLMQDQIMVVGESCAAPIEDKIIMEPERGENRDIRQFDTEDWQIYVMGQIRYQDEGGAERFMGFCRKRMRNGRFRPVKSPDYEYED